MNMDMVKIAKEFRDEKSMELFGKIECQLQIGEVQLLNKYISDWIHPVWKQVIIDKTKTNYEVSNTGIVRHTNGNVLKPQLNHKGYLRLNLYMNNDHHKPVSVHRLVAEAFIPNPENKPQVNHISGIKTCNWVGNLEWNTPTENVNHAIRNGLMRKPGNGMESRNRKYTEEDVHNVCKLLEISMPIKEISEQLNVSKAFITGIRYMGNWSYISSRYKIPKSNTYTLHSKEVIDEIDELIRSGSRNRKAILESVGLPVTNTNVSYIKYRIKIHNEMVKRSTTIGQL